MVRSALWPAFVPSGFPYDSCSSEYAPCFDDLQGRRLHRKKRMEHRSAPATTPPKAMPMMSTVGSDTLLPVLEEEVVLDEEVEMVEEVVTATDVAKVDVVVVAYALKLYTLILRKPPQFSAGFPLQVMLQSDAKAGWAPAAMVKPQ
jgi:hypothetical protein